MTARGPAVPRRTAIPAASAAVCAGLLALWHPPALADLDLAALDGFVRQTMPPAPSSRVAIVAVDEPSLAAHGQWPWPRDVLARLVEALHRAGAAAIGFDVLFPERDRLGTPIAPGGPASTDVAFATAMRGAPVVAGVALTFEAPSTAVAPLPGSCLLKPRSPVVHERDGDPPLDGLFRATGAICNVRLLADAATASGTINASPDVDGVLRRVPVVSMFDGALHGTLALAAVGVAGEGPFAIGVRSDRAIALTVGARVVMLDGHGQMLLRARGPGRTFPHVSAADVIAGRLPAAALRGKVVFVGATALGVRDAVAMPLDPRFPGVELHATVADTLLGGAAAARPAGARLLELAGPVAAAVAAAWLVARAGGLAGTGATVALALALWFAVRGWFASTGAVVSPVSTWFGLAFGVTATVVSELAYERRRANDEHRRREQAQRLIVQTLTSLTETRDADTGRHARRTQEFTRLLATTAARRGSYTRFLTPHRIDLIATLAPLHDIGKVGISDAVLHKPGQLNDAEYAEMKRHAALGHETLRKAEALAGVHDDEVLGLAKDIVFTHHERWDGSGYPQGLVADAIPIPGRIVAVVDTYDALVAERAYKAALPHDQAVAIIGRGRGTHFDPEIVDAFLACQQQFRVAEHAVDARLPADRR